MGNIRVFEWLIVAYYYRDYYYRDYYYQDLWDQLKYTMDIKLTTPNSTLTFPRKHIKDNRLWTTCIAGTIFDKHFFGEDQNVTELFLPFGGIIVDSLIEYFRDGNITLQPTVHRMEFVKFLKYCAGSNAYMLDATYQFKFGTVDIFGFTYHDIMTVKLKRYTDGMGNRALDDNTQTLRKQITFATAVYYKSDEFIMKYMTPNRIYAEKKVTESKFCRL